MRRCAFYSARIMTGHRSVLYLVCLACGFALLHKVSSQAGVCQRVVSSVQTYQVYLSVSSGYTESCFWLFRCRETRYRRVTELRTRVSYHTQPICCEGYEGDGVHCEPICSDCREPGLCVAPDTCECPVGRTGDECSEDINECDAGVCDDCINTDGSFHCMCPDGNTLPSGQVSCIDPPHMLSVVAVNSTSLFISWQAPLLDEQEAILDSFSLWCSLADSEDTSPLISKNIYHELSVAVYGLQPYTAYTCCLFATTSIGVSGTVCQTQNTQEDIPAPPQNVRVASVSPYAVEVQWNTPTAPNGVLIYYSVYYNGTLVATVNSSLMSYLIHGLSPYEQVSISVSASTRIGEGLKSVEATNRTQESAPSAVASIAVVVVTENHINISWTAPLSPNGIITGYQVTVTNLINNTRLVLDQQHNELEVSVSTGIEPYVPYEISVRATNRAAAGETREIVIFTREGISVTAPTIITAIRTDATSALMEWEPLNLEQLRGNLTSYEIVCIPLENECPPRSNTNKEETMSIQVTQPVFAITDLLDPGREYCVGIAANTGAGTGMFSYDLITWYSNSMFSLVLDVTSCSEWIDKMPSEKAADVVQEISNGIEQNCQCIVSSDYITDTKFVCDEDSNNVIFQGRIISTDEMDSDYLVNQLEMWVSNEPTIVIQKEKVQVVSRQKDNSIVQTAVGAGVAILILLLLMAIIVASVLCCRRRHNRHKGGNKNALTTRNNITAVSSNTDNPTMKKVHNPYYGYGIHGEGVPNEDAGYCEVRKQQTSAKEIANPTYGMTKNEMSAKGLASNPLYGADTASQGKDEVNMSTSGLYSEVLVSRDAHVYDAPNYS